MPMLVIDISSPAREEKKQITFYAANEWTNVNEQQLLARLQELLSTLRSVGSSFTITLDVAVSDYSLAVFEVSKRANRQSQPVLQRLSIRELQVLSLIMKGYTNKEIAEELFISSETVKSHRKNILEKTGTKNSAALVNHYHQTFFDK